MPYFTPPVVYDNPPFLPTTRGRVLMYARHRPNGPRGRSVIKLAGTYITLDGPTQAQQDAATEVYIGGHMYEISDTIATSLTAAGYSIILGFAGELLTELNDEIISESGDDLMTEYV